MYNVNADVEMLRGSITNVDYEDTQFVGSIGMMAREWGGELKQSEQTEFNRMRRTGGVFKNYVTDGDGLQQASESRMPVYYVSCANAEKDRETVVKGRRRTE